MKILKFLGTQFEKQIEPHYELLSPFIYMAISAGYKNKYSTKTNPNEDSCACFMHDDWLGAVLADAHWGKDASEILVDFVLAQCSQEIPCTLEALKLLFEKSNDFLTHKLIENDNNFISESSLLLALLNQKTGQAFLASYGDCYSFVYHQSELKEKSKRNRSWMGIGSYLANANVLHLKDIRKFLEVSPEMALLFESLAHQRMSISKGLDLEEIQLNSGDLLLLCSDGLIEPIYNIPTLELSEIEGVIRQFPSDLEGIGNQLMKESLRQDRLYHCELRGGEDNISLMLLKYN